MLQVVHITFSHNARRLPHISHCRGRKKSTRLSKSFTTMPIRHSFKMPAGVRCRCCTYCDKSSKGKAAHRARLSLCHEKHSYSSENWRMRCSSDSLQMRSVPSFSATMQLSSPCTTTFFSCVVCIMQLCESYVSMFCPILALP